MFFKNYFLKEKLKKKSYFIWNNEIKNIQSVNHFRPLDLNLIIGVNDQKTILTENTISSADANFTNNALLWGAKGTGKSSLVKSVFFDINQNHNKNLSRI